MDAETYANWRTTKFKYVGGIFSGGTPESGKPEYWDGPVSWLTPVDLGKKGSDAIGYSGRTITEEGVKAAGLDKLPPGSIVISTRAPIGSVGLLACEATTNQGCKSLVPNKRVLDSKFAYYFSLDAAEELQSLGLGTTFVELSTYALKNLRLSMPSLSHQHRIADYLDEQTAKIDRLMALRRRQMELLKEQRASVIQQAVTRGLNPNAPMKDSGIPWLREIPAHWSVISLGRLATLLQTGPFGSQLHAHEYIEGGVPIINPSHMAEGLIRHDSKCTVDEETAKRLERHFLQVGDIVFARRGEIGRCALVRNHEEGWLCGTGSMLMRPDTRILVSAYLVMLFQLKNLKESLTLQSVGSTMDNLNTGILAGMILPLPPRKEQCDILEFIENNQAKTDNLIASYARQLTILAEYRSALIHECVTGQRQV